MIEELSIHAATVMVRMILGLEEELKVGGREVRCTRIYFAIAVAKVWAKIEEAVLWTLQRKFSRDRGAHLQRT